MARLPPKIGRLLLLIALLPRCVHAFSTDEIDAHLLEIKSQANIPALAYGIVDSEGILWQQAHGHFTAAAKRPIDMRSLFRIGSVTKSFTALLALLMEEQSKLNLGSPVKEYLQPPPFVNRWEQFPISLEMLIEHTAGFADLSKVEFDQLRPLSRAAAFALAPESRATLWPPGLHSSYSNSGAGIVAAVIEKVSGKTFEQCLEEYILSPLGLASASLSPPEAMYAQLVRGYDEDGKTPIPYWHQLYPAFGALNVASSDMLKYAQMLLADGQLSGEQVFPRHVIRKMTQVTTGLAHKAGLNYGYAKGLYHFQRNGVTFFGHGGDADGYLTFIAFSKQVNRAYYIAINTFNPKAMKNMRAVIEQALTRAVTAPEPERYRLSPLEVTKLVGRYRQVTWRFSHRNQKELRVFTNREGEIYTQLGEARPLQLIPTATNLFRRPGQTDATSALSVFQGQRYLQGDFGNFEKYAELPP